LQSKPATLGIDRDKKARLFRGGWGASPSAASGYLGRGDVVGAYPRTWKLKIGQYHPFEDPFIPDFLLWDSVSRFPLFCTDI
jgi:hypothetical protein